MWMLLDTVMQDATMTEHSMRQPLRRNIDADRVEEALSLNSGPISTSISTETYPSET